MNGGAKFSTNAEVSQLVNEAQSAAVRELDGMAATPAMLDRLAVLVRRNILVQAELGLWKKLGIDGASQLEPLYVRAYTSAVAPRIRIHYDFAQTVLASLLVESKPRGRQ